MKEMSEDFKLEKNLTIPNIISLIRILLILPCAYYILKDKYITASIFLIISGISDIFDGMIARNFNQVTKLGQILDPIADKITLIVVVVCLSLKFEEIFPIACVLILKEMMMLIVGCILINKRIDPIPARWYGKLATVFFYVSVVIMIGLKAVWGFSNFVLNSVLFSITAFLMIFAMTKYFFVYLKIKK